VAQGKGELLEALPDDGHAVLSADDDMTPGLRARTGAAVLVAGASAGADIRVSATRLDDELRPAFHLDTPWGSADVPPLPVRGAHQAGNAAFAVAVAGVLGALAIASRTSADPMIQKQALAIAEAFLEEAQLMPFTFCDPGDANATTAQSATLGPTGCNATVEGPGVEGGETRYGPTFFDNVSDYNGYDSNADAPPGIKDINQSPIAELGGYRVQVSVAGQPLQGIGDDANGRPQSLLITVTVTGTDNTTVRLDGYRTRYAPNANVP